MGKKVQFHWLENRTKGGCVTWGTPWNKGEVTDKNDFLLKDTQGNKIDVQTRAMAYWPDGSYKWTEHSADCPTASSGFTLEAIQAGDMQNAVKGIQLEENADEIKISTNKMQVSFPKSGNKIIKNWLVDGKIKAESGNLACIIEERKIDEEVILRKEISYESQIQKVSIEEQGLLKCVIKVEGIHVNGTLWRRNLPFIMRFIIFNSCTEIKIMHTFICDIKPEEQFIKGIGIEFECPVQGELYNRHIKVKGDYGYFHETLALLLSWRPRVDMALYEAQLRGQFITLDEEKNENELRALKNITIWDSYRLYQDSARHFSVKKRTGKNCCSFIDAIQGEKSQGLVYIGGQTGGVAVCMKDFWQKYPSSIWVQGMSTDKAKLTVWIWSPESEALDMRHYDTVGHAMSYYEGFDEVRSTPYGVANTNEFTLYGFTDEVPSDEILNECAYKVQKPALLIAEPEYYHEVKAFGYWGLINKDTPAQTWLEEQLDKAIDFYVNEIMQRNWYGLFNYGDVMHTYDMYRHSWRYDMGGYAWQNTELVPTLWLWYAFLRSGREDIFTLAENMSRHCADVDIYHMGEYKGLGSRHNVIHWGCSCKEARIGMAGHHRFFYYLTGDYRMSDVFDDVKDADYSTLNIDPLRTQYSKEGMIYPTHARTGPDWASFCFNWFTEWERNNNTLYRDKMLTGINDIKRSPLKLISGSDYEYEPSSGHLRYIGESKSGSHLAICMGEIELWLELIDTLEDKEWEQMLAEYGEFYHLPNEEKIKRSNGIAPTRGWAFPYMAAALLAYSAKYYNSKELGEKVWNILLGEMRGFETLNVENYFNTKELKEIPFISTNFVAQWCLNVIVSLGLADKFMPEEMPKKQ